MLAGSGLCSATTSRWRNGSYPSNVLTMCGHDNLPLLIGRTLSAQETLLYQTRQL